MINDKQPKNGSLRVWWIPQIPMKPFYIPVESLKEAKKVLLVLEQYDIFQFKNNIKPDYSNAGGLQIYDDELIENGDIQSGWSDWCHAETGDTIDDIFNREDLARYDELLRVNR